ncbi:MAG: M48 family metallopeptidase [Ruminococcus sp.]|nr:M48 family metallopeptidase [Ruminococcus sp.]
MSRQRKTMILENGRELEYILDRGKRKNIYIAVKDGEVLLRIPYYADAAAGERFLREKSGWVLQSLQKREKASAPEEYHEGLMFSMGGESFTVTAVEVGRHFPPRFVEGRLEIAVNSRAGAEKDRAAYIDAQARKAVAARTKELVAEAFERLSPLLGLWPKKVTIKKMTASWGRCSSTGNISINSAIVFFDRECIDYVVAHELCHLRHMDHSPAFWALVSTVCPEWKRIRAKLRL